MEKSIVFSFQLFKIKNSIYKKSNFYSIKSRRLIVYCVINLLCFIIVADPYEQIFKFSEWRHEKSNYKSPGEDDKIFTLP